jgi:ribosomal protein S14
MGDDEARREDARIDALIDKAYREGRIAECFECGREDWVEYGAYDDETIPLCRRCFKEHEAKY